MLTNAFKQYVTASGGHVKNTYTSQRTPCKTSFEKNVSQKYQKFIGIYENQKKAKLKNDVFLKILTKTSELLRRNEMTSRKLKKLISRFLLILL